MDNGVVQPTRSSNPVTSVGVNPTSEITPTDGETTIMKSTSSALISMIDQAKTSLADMLSISIPEIDLIKADAVTWPDSSLGCPQEGMAYAQILTSGYLILLSYAGKNYEYHAGRDQQVFYCKGPTQPVPGIPGDN